MSTYTKYVPKTIEPTNLNGWKENAENASSGRRYLIYVPEQDAYYVSPFNGCKWQILEYGEEYVYVYAKDALHYDLTNEQYDWLKDQDCIYGNCVDNISLELFCDNFKDFKFPEFREIE